MAYSNIIRKADTALELNHIAVMSILRDTRSGNPENGYDRLQEHVQKLQIAAHALDLTNEEMGKLRRADPNKAKEVEQDKVLAYKRIDYLLREGTLQGFNHDTAYTGKLHLDYEE